MEAAAFVVVLVTVPDEATGERIARALLDERLAACVNRLGPVHSLFRWEGRLDAADEQLLVIKARQCDFDRLAERVRALHPYQVPEVIALPVVAGSTDYLRWLAAETGA